jgi:hypothetical protein
LIATSVKAQSALDHDQFRQARRQGATRRTSEVQVKQKSGGSVSPEAVSSALQQLNALIDEILFGQENWPPDPQIVFVKLNELGLEVGVPGDPSSSRSTELGRAVGINLYMAFLGVYSEDEIPMILKPYGIFAAEEAEMLWDRLEAGEDVWDWLQRRLQLAYRDHFGQRVAN